MGSLSKEEQERILATALDLAKVATGAGITWFTAWLSARLTEKKQLRERLVALKTAFELSISNDNRARALQGLRRLFIENRKLLEEDKGNQEFFGEHLAELDDQILPSPQFWTTEKIRAVLMDLAKLKI